MEKQDRIGDWMKRNVVFVRPDVSIREATALIIDKRVGTLPVVGEEGTLLGVASISDIIKIFLPDFVSLLSNIDFIKDFGALRTPSPRTLNKAKSLSVVDIMRGPVTVEENTSLIRALAVMQKHGLRDLIVVRDEKLVGIASRVDIGRAFLINWQTSL